jgi:hypothetical protein
MKTVIILVGFLFFSTTGFALTEDMKCYSGNCDQWKGWYERWGDAVRLHFENISGKPLFKIKATIRYFDYMDEYLGQSSVKLEGPIHKYFTPRFTVHRKTSRIEFDINCTDEYEGSEPSQQAD